MVWAIRCQKTSASFPDHKVQIASFVWPTDHMFAPTEDKANQQTNKLKPVCRLWCLTCGDHILRCYASIHVFCLYEGFITCVWDVPPGHIVACLGRKLGSKGRIQTVCPAACEPVYWICGMPAAAGVSGPAGRSPSPGGSYAGSGHRRCVHMVCREAAPGVAGRYGTPGHRPLPGGSCKGGSPSCGGSGHTPDTAPPAMSPPAQKHSPRSLGCPSLFRQHSAALAQMTPEVLQCWEGAHTPISFRGWTGCREDRCPPVADGTSPYSSQGTARGLNSCFRKTTSVWLCARALFRVANALCTWADVSARDREWHYVCVSVNVLRLCIAAPVH